MQHRGKISARENPDRAPKALGRNDAAPCEDRRKARVSAALHSDGGF